MSIDAKSRSAILLALAIGAVVWLITAGVIVVAGQGTVTPAATPHVVGVLYSDGTWATVTPVPSVPPTNTPRATDAPAPTATATPGSAPTQEHATPSATPPTAAPIACEVKLQDFNIRLRAAPTIAAPVVGLVENRTVQAVYEWRENAGYLWARTADGWFAARQTSWWVHGIEGQSEMCVDVPGWPGGLAPPEPLVRAGTAWGVWAGPGASTAEVLEMIAELQAAGVQPAVTVYGANELGRRAHEAGALVLARPWLGDHPPYTLSAAESARAWVDKAALNLGAGWYDCVVLSNEPIYPSWAYARDWIAAAIARADERGMRCVVPVVWAPGHPDLAAVDVLRGAYAGAAIQVYWGLNLYPVEAHMALAERNAWTQYTTWRYELYEPPAPVVVTEFARGDGAQRADMADIARWVDAVDGEFAAATAWYVAGPSGLGHWPDAVLWGRLVELAGVIVGAIS